MMKIHGNGNSEFFPHKPTVNENRVSDYYKWYLKLFGICVRSQVKNFLSIFHLVLKYDGILAFYCFLANSPPAPSG